MHIYTKKKKKRRRGRNEAHNDTWQWEYMQKGRTYLQLGLVKQNGAGGRCILLMLKLQKKKKKKREISKYSYGVSRRKALQNRKKMKKK